MNAGVVLAALGAIYLAQSSVEPAPDIAAGRKTFEGRCAVCHGVSGGGGRGPSLYRPEFDKAPDDAALRTLITQGIEPEMPGAWMLLPREVINVAAYVRSVARVPPDPVPGDPAHGAAVYRANRCSGCHIIRGDGIGFGPELTSTGARRSAAHLREALIKPEAFTPKEFVSVEAVTSFGETISGIRANEDTFTIQIKDSTGRFHSFRKGELKELRILHNQSAMPSYQTLLSPADMQDLVAYLASLRGRE
jgi:cytochrome c oxidase cbb3-type subunit III